MEKIAFFDLDGTLRQPKSGARFITNPTDQEPIPGAIALLNHVSSFGWSCVGITNQESVAANYKTLESCVDEQVKTLRIFPQILGILFCVDFEGEHAYYVNRNYMKRGQKTPQLVKLVQPCRGKGRYRKPHIALLEYASAHSGFGGKFYQGKWGYICENSIMIGDRPEDKECARNAGIDFYWAEDARSRPYIITPYGMNKEDIVNFHTDDPL